MSRLVAPEAAAARSNATATSTPDAAPGATLADTLAATAVNLLNDTLLGNLTDTLNATAPSPTSPLLLQPSQRELPIIRGVEVGIVLMVLVVWAGAIALFFNRWGKIRMLLPYTPDYKHTQMKVPGGTCSGQSCHGHHKQQRVFVKADKFHDHGHDEDEDSCLPRCGGLFDRCFHCPRKAQDRQCGCQFSLLHRADPES